MATKLVLIKEPPKEPPRPVPAHILEHILWRTVTNELEKIATDLCTSRAFWREHRQLVESTIAPEPYASLDDYANFVTSWPNAGLSTAQLRDVLLPEVEEFAEEHWRDLHQKGPEAVALFENTYKEHEDEGSTT